MLLRSFAAAALAALSIGATALPQSASAQSAFDRCYDRNGTAVIVRASHRVKMGNVAIAARLRGTGQPIIAYNPTAMKRLHPITRIYVYYHECAHHVLGHTSGHRPPTREADADCWAIKYMARRGLLNWRGLRYIQRDIIKSRGSHIHLAGHHRASLLAGCLRSAGTSRVAMRKPSGGAEGITDGSFAVEIDLPGKAS